MSITSIDLEPHSRRHVARWLALGGVVSPVLFTAAWVGLGLLQPPVRNIYGVMGGIAGKDHAALFVGQWAAPFLIMGLYNKVVKQHGSDAASGAAGIASI